MVVQESDGLDPPVGLDATAGNELGNDGANAEQVDLTESEMTSYGTEVQVHRVHLTAKCC